MASSRIRDTDKDAQSLLDHIVSEDAEETLGPEDVVSVEEALHERPLMSYDAGREKSRVLFVTNDTAFLNPVDDALDRFYELSQYFDEMHIMVLRSGVLPTKPVLRVRENIWLYVASAQYWWWTPVIAHEVVAANQLVFAGGFRPDIVVALEPFESGLAAQWIAKAHDRPVQIHVRKDFLSDGFLKASPRNRWRKWFARYVLRRAYSVRVQTSQIRDKIRSLCAADAHIQILPRFNNFAAIRDTALSVRVHEVYPMYEKILLFIGSLDYNSTLFGAIDIMKYVLANPRVGLLVLGDGPTKAECESKVHKLGLSTQVAFPKHIQDIASYLKSADVLVVTDRTAAADEIALQGAVAGIPTIMLENEIRNEYFTDGRDAYLCPEDEACFKNKIHRIVHDKAVRTQFAAEVKKTVRPHLALDASVYQEQYRNLIELVFLDEPQAPATPRGEVEEEVGEEAEEGTEPGTKE